MLLAPLLVNRHLARLLFSLSQHHQTSRVSVPSTPFSIANPGTIPAAGLWASVGIDISVNEAMVNPHLPTAPFEPTRDLSATSPSLHLGENVVGVNNKVALNTAAAHV